MSYEFSWEIALIAIIVAALIMGFTIYSMIPGWGIGICFIVYVLVALINLFPDNVKSDDDLTATETAERVYNMPVDEAVPLSYGEDGVEGFQITGYNQAEGKLFVDFKNGDTTSKLALPTAKIEFVTADEASIRIDLSDEKHEDYGKTFGTVSYTPEDKYCHIDTLYYTCPYNFSESARAKDGLTLAYLVDITLERVTVALPADIYEELGI